MTPISMPAAPRVCTVDPRLRPRDPLRRLLARIEREHDEERALILSLLPRSRALMRLRDGQDLYVRASEHMAARRLVGRVGL